MRVTRPAPAGSALPATVAASAPGETAAQKIARGRSEDAVSPSWITGTDGPTAHLTIDGAA